MSKTKAARGHQMLGRAVAFAVFPAVAILAAVYLKTSPSALQAEASAASAPVRISAFYPREGEVFRSGVRYTPFTQELPLPPVKSPSPAFEPQCNIPENLGPLETPAYYEVRVRESSSEIVPGFQTAIWGYDSIYPGPTFRSRHRVPTIVRFHNELREDLITHTHGGHQTSESDGNPAIHRQQIPPGQFRDFCYTNTAPFHRSTGTEDLTAFPSTLWYHDHVHGITGRNVYRGLAGFHLYSDELEEDLIRRNVLPAAAYDIPIAIQDRTLNAQGQLVYRPGEHNFDGFLGDIPVLNGKAQPRLRVERRKYRFRFLNGSTARFVQLALTSGSFIQIGSDSWLLGQAVRPAASDDRGTRQNEIRLTPAERADVVIDFSQAPNEVYLVNNLYQVEGRRPDRAVDLRSDRATAILKFEVVGPAVADDATVAVGTPLRPHRPILASEITRTREFRFERRGGEWVINDLPFDHHRVDANPVAGAAERWVLRNNSGGWAHPIHIHLESHEIQSLRRRPLDPQEEFKKDTVRLDPGEEAEIFMKFRTFPGKWVFHCHNNEHEDHAMMVRFDVVEEPGQAEAATDDQAITGPDPRFPPPPPPRTDP